MQSMNHPRLDEDGHQVTIGHPDTPSSIDAWDAQDEMTTATPDCAVPATIGEVAVQPWLDAPAARAAWEAIAAVDFDEPDMPEVAGKRPAAGVVVIEPDGRVWIVSPTNHFGGYAATFPKGKADGMSLHATAIKEAFEESGLRVALTGYLCDSVRSTSVARYYTARRVGGSPAAMGWESQAVRLVPIDKLAEVANHPNDKPVVQALSAKSVIAYQFGLAPGHRILMTLAGYHRKYGAWPERLIIPSGMYDGLRNTILTPRGWRLLTTRLRVDSKDDASTLYAEGPGSQWHEYDASGLAELQRRASIWIWNVDLLY